MAFVVADRVQETCTSPGTATVTLLGAVYQFQTFSSAIGANNTTYYVIADQVGANWEVGLGTVGAAGTTLARTTVLASSNGGSIVNFLTGNQYVWVDYPASKIVVQGGAVSFSSITNSGLTSGRVTFASTGGLLADSANLTFDGTALTAGNFVPSSATVPTYGMYLPITNAIGFTTASTERMRIDSSGHVGIGTSSPTTTLDVKSKYSFSVASNGAIKIGYYNNTTQSGYIDYINAFSLTANAKYYGAGQNTAETTDSSQINLNGSAITFATNSGLTAGTQFTPTERMRLDSSGNLGLGVTPSAWSVGKAFELGGVGAGLWNAGTAGDIFLTSNAYYNAGWKYAATNASTNYEQNAGVHRWSNAPSGTAGNPITFTQAMTLDASGNLGIGTTSPAYNLHVQGTAPNFGIRDTTSATTGVGGTIYLQGYTNGTASPTSFATIVGAKENSTAGNGAGYFTISTTTSAGATTERMRIFSSGGVSIGNTTDPGATNLSVTGNILSNGATGVIGYATGSGGAVTQLTSRTTGVTLNKSNGAITLFTAAGSATATTFTVTNSTVAATDVIHVCQKSGTNLYNTLVTAVAAGSFNITFYTTGGVASDAPVFNFTLIKAVTA